MEAHNAKIDKTCVKTDVGPYVRREYLATVPPPVHPFRSAQALRRLPRFLVVAAHSLNVFIVVPINII